MALARRLLTCAVLLLLSAAGLRADTILMGVAKGDPVLLDAVRLAEASQLDPAEAKVRAYLRDKPDSAPGHEILGAVQLLKGQVDAALASLRRAVELDPKQYTAMIKIGDVELSRGQRGLAREQYQKALAIRPSDPTVHQQLGRLEEAERNYDLALDHYRKGAVGGDVAAKADLGRLYNMSGQFSKTVELLQASAASNPGALIVLGTAQLGLGKPDEAVKSFEAAGRLDPSSAGVPIALGIAYREKGAYPQSLQALDEAVKRDPKSSTAYYQRAETLLKTGDSARAITDLQTAAQLSPSPAGSRRRLGQVYLGLGRTSEAIAMGQGLVAQPNASFESWGFLGDAYQAAGQLAQSERTFVEAAGKFPKLPIAHWRLGTIYGFQRKYALAIGAFNRGLAIAPEDPSLLRGLAFAQNQSGNHKAAILTAEKLVKLQPGDAEAAFLLGTLYQDQGRAEDAKRVYRDVIRLKPDHALGHNNLAAMLTESGQAAEALPLARKAATLAPENLFVLDTLGWALEKNGQHKEAREALEKAATRQPPSPTVLYHLAVACQALGDGRAARQALEKALALSKDFPEATAARKTLSTP